MPWQLSCSITGIPVIIKFRLRVHGGQAKLHIYVLQQALPVLGLFEHSFVVFPRLFDEALLHVFHQLPVNPENIHDNIIAAISIASYPGS